MVVCPGLGGAQKRQAWWDRGLQRACCRRPGTQSVEGGLGFLTIYIGSSCTHVSQDSVINPDGCYTNREFASQLRSTQFGESTTFTGVNISNSQLRFLAELLSLLWSPAISPFHSFLPSSTLP